MATDVTSPSGPVPGSKFVSSDPSMFSRETRLLRGSEFDAGNASAMMIRPSVWRAMAVISTLVPESGLKVVSRRPVCAGVETTWPSAKAVTMQPQRRNQLFADGIFIALTLVFISIIATGGDDHLCFSHPSLGRGAVHQLLRNEPSLRTKRNSAKG